MDALRSAVLLPVAVDESMGGGVPKPIRWDPTNSAVLGEQRVRLFLGEDSLGVQANASAADYGAIRRGLDNGRERPATAEQERHPRVHDQEKHQTPHENLRVKTRRLIAFTHRCNNSDLLLQERDAVRCEGSGVIFGSVGRAPHVVGQWRLDGEQH